MFITFADEWYCHICKPDGQDHLLQYSKAVVFHGLRHLARRQAIRDGNGHQIIDEWRLIDSWNGNHKNYVISSLVSKHEPVLKHSNALMNFKISNC